MEAEKAAGAVALNGPLPVLLLARFEEVDSIRVLRARAGWRMALATMRDDEAQAERPMFLVAADMTKMCRGHAKSR